MKGKGIVMAAVMFAAGYFSNTVFTSPQKLEERLVRQAPVAEMDRFTADYVANRRDADYRMQVIKKAYAGLQGPEQDKVIKQEFQLIPENQSVRKIELASSLVDNLNEEEWRSVSNTKFGRMIENYKSYTKYPLKLELKINDILIGGMEDIVWYAKHIRK